MNESKQITELITPDELIVQINDLMVWAKDRKMSPLVAFYVFSIAAKSIDNHCKFKDMTVEELKIEEST